MPKKLRVGVIFGGRSGEHEVSIRSARAIVESIDRKKFDIVPIAITKEGKWLPPAHSAQLLPAAVQPLVAASATTTDDVALLGDPSHKGLISLKGNAQPLVAEKLERAIPALRGKSLPSRGDFGALLVVGAEHLLHGLRQRRRGTPNTGDPRAAAKRRVI